MLNTPAEVVTVVVAGTAILLLLVSFIVSFLFTYQKKQQMHKIEKEQLKRDHEKAIQESRIEIQEETLKYVGRELHDNVGQILSLVKLHLHDVQNHQQVTYAKELISGAITDVRTLSKTLNTDWADAIPLPFLISKELEKVERSGLIQTELLHDEVILDLDNHNKLIVFRVFQESINNIIKHANATDITVNFHLPEGENTCILEITDNGKGFDQVTAAGGSGLINMRKRMETIQGKLEITSRLNSGTRIELRFPCHHRIETSYLQYHD